MENIEKPIDRTKINKKNLAGLYEEYNGNIARIAREMKSTYPTVKKYLNIYGIIKDEKKIFNEEDIREKAYKTMGILLDKINDKTEENQDLTTTDVRILGLAMQCSKEAINSKKTNEKTEEEKKEEFTYKTGKNTKTQLMTALEKTQGKKND